MASTQTLDIKVVFDSTARKGKRGRVVRISAQGTRRAGGTLSLLSILIGAGLCYVTWWQIQPYIYINTLIHTPLSIDLNMVSGTIFGVTAPSAQEELSPRAVVAEAVGMESGSHYNVVTTRKIVAACAGGWLGLSTLSCFCLALAGAAFFGRGAPAWLRGLCGLVAVLLVLGLAWTGYQLVSQYETRIVPDDLRFGMAAAILLAVIVGLAIGRGARGLYLLAGVVFILAAAGSVAGLFLGNRCGAVEAERATAQYMVIVFAVHSFWGWVVLVLRRRVRG